MKKILVLFFTICSFSHLMGNTINWSAPVTLSTAGVTASDPRTVIDQNGNATAVWVESGLVKASSQPVNGSWSAPTTLSGAGASSPRLGIDSSGNVTAIWIQSDVVESSTLPFNGSWSAATAVSGSGASSPALAVDSAGNAVAVWVRNGFIESSTFPVLGLWSLVAQLSTDVSSSPDVAIGANGTVVAVWHAVSSGANIIESATALLAGTWGASKKAITGVSGLSHDFPKVVVDSNGNATVAWFRYALGSSIYQNVSVLSSSLISGAASWSLPTMLTSGGEILNVTNLSLRLSMDTSGNVVALWSTSYDGSTFSIESAVKPAGGSWNPAPALQLSALYPYQVDVAANNALGNTVAAYMVFDGISSVIIQSQESNVAAPGTVNWSAPQTISQGVDNGYPRIVAAVNGPNVYSAAVWVSFDGVSNVIAASSGSKTVISPPTNLAVTQGVNNFGVFTEYNNTLSWTLSASPNIQQYNIYRNSIFFISVDPNVTQVIDHNATQNGSVTYGVSSQDSSQTVSQIATINFP